MSDALRDAVVAGRYDDGVVGAVLSAISAGDTSLPERVHDQVADVVFDGDGRRIDALFGYLQRVLTAFGHRHLRCFNAVCLQALDRCRTATVMAYAKDLCLRDHEFLRALMRRFCTDRSAPECVLHLLRHHCSIAPGQFLEQLQTFLQPPTSDEAVQLLFSMAQDQMLSLSHLTSAPLYAGLMRDLLSSSSVHYVSLGAIAIAMAISHGVGTATFGDASQIYGLLRYLLGWNIVEASPITTSRQSRSNSLPASNLPPPPSAVTPPVAEQLPVEVMYAAVSLFRSLYTAWPWETVCFMRQEVSRSPSSRSSLQFLFKSLPFHPGLIGCTSEGFDVAMSSTRPLETIATANVVRSSHDDGDHSLAAPSASSDVELWKLKNGFTLPEDAVGLRMAAQLMQVELAFEHFQRKQLESRLSAKNGSIRTAHRGTGADAKERARFNERLHRARDELRQCKQQHRKWETELLHKLDKVSSQRSSKVAALQAESKQLRADANRSDQAAFVAEQVAGKLRQEVENGNLTIKSLRDQIREQERQFTEFRTRNVDELRREFNQREENMMNKIVGTEEQAARVRSQLTKAHGELEALKLTVASRDKALDEARELLREQRGLTSPVTILQDRATYTHSHSANRNS
ncbi:unnamed protein product (mitochondrion) [Plasmodiophora brassicae]|uniref:Uncharacterized protein n=1 Tax=Plasmodiophora brassicae TaxID=37360 RepID=A0A3P3Y4X8_PLABS|nr:unnamed protein product [Plasmodiophora brassicae]